MKLTVYNPMFSNKEWINSEYCAIEMKLYDFDKTLEIFV